MTIRIVKTVKTDKIKTVKTVKTDKTDRIKTVKTDKTIRTFVRDHLNRPKVSRSQSSYSPLSSLSLLSLDPPRGPLHILGGGELDVALLALHEPYLAAHGLDYRGIVGKHWRERLLVGLA